MLAQPDKLTDSRCDIQSNQKHPADQDEQIIKTVSNTAVPSRPAPKNDAKGSQDRDSNIDAKIVATEIMDHCPGAIR